MRRRLHLFEFGDQPWLPQVLHDGETAYLATVYRVVPLLPRLWAEKISTVLDPAKPAEIVDLCSGSGGPMPLIIQELEKRGHKAHATLTDLYPNRHSADPRTAAPSNVEWVTEPVDARRVPPKLKGVRTMFSAFHHFRPADAKAILKDAFDRRDGICIFESGPSTRLALAMVPRVLISLLVLMPFARPFRWSHLVFTYLIPLIPLILLWDFVVSILRLYSPEQMKKLTEDLQAPDYVWEIGLIRMPRIPFGLPYLIGRPISPGAAAQQQ